MQERVGLLVLVAHDLQKRLRRRVPDLGRRPVERGAQVGRAQPARRGRGGARGDVEDVAAAGLLQEGGDGVAHHGAVVDDDARPRVGGEGLADHSERALRGQVARPARHHPQARVARQSSVQAPVHGLAGALAQEAFDDDDLAAVGRSADEVAADRGAARLAAVAHGGGEVLVGVAVRARVEGVDRRPAQRPGPSGRRGSRSRPTPAARPRRWPCG